MSQALEIGINPEPAIQHAADGCPTRAIEVEKWNAS
jgi:ferredoxin